MSKTPYELAVEKAIGEDGLTTRELALLLREHGRQNSIMFASIRQSERANKEALELRLHTLNDLRKQVTEDRERFVTKLVYDVQHASVTTDVQSLRETRANAEGKASQTSVLVASAFGVVGTVMGVVQILVHVLTKAP